MTIRFNANIRRHRNEWALALLLWPGGTHLTITVWWWSLSLGFGAPYRSDWFVGAGVSAMRDGSAALYLTPNLWYER